MSAFHSREVDSPSGPAAVAPLAATFVAYTDRPDRVTVYPPGLSSVARMSTWITVDADDCVDLASMR